MDQTAWAADEAEALDEAAWDAAVVEDEASEMLDDREALADDVDAVVAPFRVSADIASKVGVWKGVRSCSDKDRAVAAMRPHYEAWVAKTRAAHPGRRVLFQGYSGERWWKKRKADNGRRSCKGGWKTLTVYVDFE